MNWENVLCVWRGWGVDSVWRPFLNIHHQILLTRLSFVYRKWRWWRPGEGGTSAGAEASLCCLPYRLSSSSYPLSSSSSWRSRASPPPCCPTAHDTTQGQIRILTMTNELHGHTMLLLNETHRGRRAGLSHLMVFSGHFWTAYLEDRTVEEQSEKLNEVKEDIAVFLLDPDDVG